MKNYIYNILILFSAIAFGQSADQNYVKTVTYKEPITDVQSTQYATQQTQVTYLDGLGRPIQQIAGKASPTGKDIITHIEYDDLGRQVKEYLPYMAAGSAQQFDAMALINTETFNDDFHNTQVPYSRKFFEASSLSRISKQAAPGESWAGVEDTDNNVNNDADHTIKYNYLLNSIADQVKRFEVVFETGNTEMTDLKWAGYYSKNQLYKTITRDENWVSADGKDHTTEEYKDKQGRLILKRTFNEGVRHDTYYVYDKFANLTYVIPPLADNVAYSALSLSFPAQNYPWTSLVLVDQSLADKYEKLLEAYDNEEILNLDLINEYGGQGGFSLSSDGTTISLDINIAVTNHMPFRTGPIADLRALGNFHDMEIGELKGSGYTYYFTIKNNFLHVVGSGKVPSMNVSYTNTKLSYSRNYPWTMLANADPNVIRQYEEDIKNLPNEDILTTYTPNAYGAMGGVSVNVADDDTVTIALNIDTNQPFSLKNGALFPLDLQRSLPDMVLGNITGTGYNYEVSIKNNSLYFSGSGTIGTINFLGSKRPTIKYFIRSEVVDGLCYIYHHDHRNRVVEKKIPDRVWEYLVYDQRDRIVATGPALTPFGGTNIGWLYTYYDVLDRPAVTGWFPVNGVFDTTLRVAQQALPEHSGQVFNLIRNPATCDNIAIDYRMGVIPTGFKLLTASYYDDYNFPDVVTPIPNMAGSYPLASFSGLATGGWVRVLTSPAETYGTTTYTLYDERARAVYARSINSYLGTDNLVQSSLDFTGKVLGTNTFHLKNGLPELKVYDDFDYDDNDRLIQHRQAFKPFSGMDMAQNWNVLLRNEYDEIGQLKEKKVGGYSVGGSTPTALQRVTHYYNVRGWLTAINKMATASMSGERLFAFQIKYDNPTSGQALYNGNISETWWMSATGTMKKRGYTYVYDAMNRLNDANYVSEVTTEKYTEGSIDYDKNGNIMSLKRYGKSGSVWTLIDDLTYISYPNSNRLKQVDDASGTLGFNNGSTGTDYEYDAFGSMDTDHNKGIGTTSATKITYNHMNLPVKVTFTTNKHVQYIYDATGAKLEKKIRESSTIYTNTQYNNGFIYSQSNAVPANTLQFFSHPEGYVKVGAPTLISGVLKYNNFDYIYQYKDHLGNVRLSYTDANDNGVITTSEVVEEDNYYAFGLKHVGYGTNQPSIGSIAAQRYKYNGKELQDELGLQWYDYQARNYDPALGRWFNVDPLAEKSRRFSTYTYCLDNPVFYIDPDGMEAEVAEIDAEAEIEGNMDTNFTPPTEYNLNVKTGTITKVSDCGGDTTDYYNVGETNAEGEFVTQDIVSIDRGDNCSNINTFRFEETTDSTTSAFNVPGTDITGYILEPGGPSTSVANQDQRIPEDTYNMEAYSSKKYPDNFLIYNDVVPKGRLILLHTGNTGADTAGCLLPGTGKSTGSVSNSKGKFNTLSAHIKSVGVENMQVKVNNIIP